MLVQTVLELLADKKIDRSAAKVLIAAARAAEAGGAAAKQTDGAGTNTGPVAIIGVSAQLPGAATYEEFWNVLARAEDRVEAPPAQRRALADPYLSARRDELDVDPAKPYWDAAWLTDIDKFDAAFFGIAPAEARAMDPQQRRFLQAAYECLEDAGYAGERTRGSRTGVFVSAASAGYLEALPELTPTAVPGNVPAFVASRLSFLYDLRGPAYLVNATCASSLLAVHDACTALANGDCERALVGGVTVFPFPLNSRRWPVNAAGIVSDEQRSRPFDAAAGGIGRGEGAVAVLLKPYAAAIRDRDRIHGVILGSATNNDGSGAALTAPNPVAHTDLLLRAWRRAGISPESLDYLEAHGTGTKLGDPIEMKGIGDAVRKTTDRRQFIALGSVKGNIGHLVDGTAGLSGLVKALLVLRHRAVPPTVGLTEPNRHIDFLNSPGFVPTRMWPLRPAGSGQPLRAGVSCFGFNGTNVHVVLEEPPAPKPVPADDPPAARGAGGYVFPLSARDDAALLALVRRYAAWTPGAFDTARDIAYTLFAGREHFATRLAVLADGLDAFRATCRALAGSPRERWAEISGVVLPGAEPDRPGAADRGAAQRTAAVQYVDGGTVDWRELFAGTEPKTAALPTYPFQEQSYWFSYDTPAGAGRAGREADPVGRVLAVARDVLGIDELAPEHSFLAVGGTSLSAMQLVSKLRREFEAKVALEDVLSAADFRTLAETVFPDGAGTAADPADGTHSSTDSPSNGAGTLSAAQRAFWFLDQVEADHTHYHVPIVLRLRGKLDLDALAASLREVERRHAILRTSYPVDDNGVPSLAVAPEPAARMEVTDLCALPAAERDAAVDAAALNCFGRRFDLEHGPVWRAALIRVADDEHVLVVVMHHIVSDIWSLKVFESDLWAAYARAAGQGPHAAAAELPSQYSDFAAWQNSYLSGEGLRTLSRYWTRQLADLGDPLELPADRPRGTVRTLRGRTFELGLPAGTAEAVAALSAAGRATPFMVFLTAFYAWLHRRTGRTDLVIGTEVAGRTHPGAEMLIGPFVNQLALRVSVAGNPTAQELLDRVRATALGAFEHQDLPFERLVEILNPARDAASTPLFGIKMLFNNISVGERRTTGIAVEPGDIPVHTSPFDLTLRVFDHDGAYSCSLTYSTDLFDDDTAAGFAEEFRRALAAVLKRPQMHISGIDLTEGTDGAAAGTGAATSIRAAGRRRAVPRAQPLVRTRRFSADGVTVPLVAEPAVGGVDLAEWIRANRAQVLADVTEHGAILFRGFNVASVDQFHAAATAVHPELVEYIEPSTPRGEYRDKVYVSSEYPNWYSIPLHGELSYTYKWPLKALFYAKKAAAKGGETPLADAREMLKRLHPEVRRRFQERHVMYVRNYGGGMLVPWEKAFGTTDRAEVERYCRENGPMQAEWLDDGRLRTWQVRPATAVHPITGDEVWFNQAHIFHVYSLGEDMQTKLYEQFGEDGLPVHARYGDGSRIENWELDEIYRAYEECKWAAPWTDGDVLLADNMLMAHGRHPFEGDRETVVAFVEPVPDAAVRKLPSTDGGDRRD